LYLPDGSEPKQEAVTQPKEEEKRPPLPLVKRYFHILGIDVILDSDMNPQVLELNDRPSLGVTVEFEKDLKEGVIADTFEHVKANGETRGNSPETSQWEQIYPVPAEKAGVCLTHWSEILHRILHPEMERGDFAKMPIPAQIPRRSVVEFMQKKGKKKKKGKKEKACE
jgi:hypothetical protein